MLEIHSRSFKRPQPETCPGCSRPDSTTFRYNEKTRPRSELSFLAVLLQQRIGRNLLLPLVAFGVWSVWYWQATGDLRPYILAQFFTLLAVPLNLILFPGEGSQYWCWKFTHETLSGHSLKHVLAAAALIPLLFVTTKKHGHDAGQSEFGTNDAQSTHAKSTVPFAHQQSPLHREDLQHKVRRPLMHRQLLSKWDRS